MIASLLELYPEKSTQNKQSTDNLLCLKYIASLDIDTWRDKNLRPAQTASILRTQIAIHIWIHIHPSIPTLSPALVTDIHLLSI